MRGAAGRLGDGLAHRAELALATAAAGSLVILESWFTALGFLHRCPPLRLKARWMIFLAALVPGWSAWASP